MYQRIGNTFTLIDNPLYTNNQCPKYGLLEKTIIMISDFISGIQPMGITGPLYEPNMKIIKDNVFKIIINYPLSYEVEIDITNGESDTDFTITGILSLICLLYKNIYEEEINTSSAQIYNLKKNVFKLL